MTQSPTSQELSAYLDDTDTKWDVVISDLSDPIEEGPSFKLFTKEYFDQIKGVLAERGKVVIQAGPTSPAEITIHARLVRCQNPPGCPRPGIRRS